MADKKEKAAVNKWNGLPYSKRYLEISAQRRKLPVWAYKEKVLHGLKDKLTLVLAADTGSGKTTQVPQFVLEAVYDIETSPLVDKLPNPKMMVACTFTSPMTAIFASHLVALEMDVTIREEVCFQNSSEECISEKGILNFLPDNVLLCEAMADPLLKRYKVIIVDDAHSRTCVKDMLLGLLKDVLKRRSDMKLVVISGTTIREMVGLTEFFGDASLVTVYKGYFPVDIVYLEEKPKGEEEGYLEEAIKRVLKIHLDENSGDVLVFLAEEKEIEVACLEIIKRVEKVKMHTPVKLVALNSLSPPVMLQIYESAPLAMKKSGPAGRKMVVTTNNAETSLAIDEIFYSVDPRIEDSGFTGRRIVVTTDIAETSPSISDIVYVVDCGYARQKTYCNQVHAESVKVLPISKIAAEKRSEQAGRTRLGKCFRLYTRKIYNNLQPDTDPFTHSNIACTILTLKKLGINAPKHFDSMGPPDPERLKRALKMLNYLGALDDEGNLTKIGENMAEFPQEPQMSKMLVGSPEFHCSPEILTISAMLLTPDCFVCPNEEFQKAADEAKARFCHVDGDHITLLNVYNAYTQTIDKTTWCSENFVNARALEFADYLRHQLLCVMLRLGFALYSTDVNSRDYYVNIRKAILAGYFMQVAHLNPSGQYFTVKDNQKVTLHLLSSQDHKPEWVVYNEFIRGEVGQTNSIRTVTPVCEEWLVELVPHYWKNVKKDNQEGE